VMPANVTTLYSDRHTLHAQLEQADLVVGAVLVPGAKAPCLVEQDDLLMMKPGSVIVDVAIDQGGCVATSRSTTHSEPTFVINDVVHYCVANMPGAVGRTSTFALCNATLPWVLQLANLGVDDAARGLPEIASAINIYCGEVTNRAVATTFGMHCAMRFAT
jgi:alanine dehydrogenase